MLVEIDDLIEKDLYRTLTPIDHKGGIKITLQERELINFSTNDYLGLSQHPYLIGRAKEMLDQFGTGFGSSRLVSGNNLLFESIEKKLSSLKESEAALIFNSGYSANITLLPALIDRTSLILMDKYCHNSLYMGALLSHAKVLRYKHNDFENLEKLLIQHKDKCSKIFVVTESLFSMDGDITDLDHLIELKKKYSFFIYLDEAHATGTMGKNGMGLSVGRKEIDLSMGTFSKALGSFGAYISISDHLKKMIINCCGGVIFTTALPPPILGSIDAALDLITQIEDRREYLRKISQKLRMMLLNQGWGLTNSSSHIIPVILKKNDHALKISQDLLKMGIYAVAIKSQTVPDNSSRIRFSLSSDHDEKDIIYLAQCMDKLKSKCG